MGTMLSRIATAAILLLGSAATADAQYGAAIRGVIRDVAGRPTAGAVVTLSHPGARLVRVAVTDLRGEYAIHGLEPGAEYVVQVTHPNFRKERVQARAYAASQHVTPVRLKPRRATAAR
jgi:hypothetical protein